MEQTDEILSAKEAARYLRIALPTFYRYIREERIPCTKIGGRWKFKRSVLEQWLEQRMRDRSDDRARLAIAAV